MAHMSGEAPSNNRSFLDAAHPRQGGGWLRGGRLPEGVGGGRPKAGLSDELLVDDLAAFRSRAITLARAPHGCAPGGGAHGGAAVGHAGRELPR